MASLRCRLFGHRRSRRDARRIDHRWISYCRRCESLMVREAPDRWSAVAFFHGVAVDPRDQGLQP